MSEQLQEHHVKRLFMMLHGMYGNPVLDKFRTGQTNEAGEDIGIMNANKVWLAGLREFSFETLRRAVSRCEEKHKAFPPTLPEFRDVCRSVAPRAVSQSNAPRIGISPELRSKYVEEQRKAIAEVRAKRAGDGHISNGLPGLLALIASAVGCAGGNEVETLMRLEKQT